MAAASASCENGKQKGQPIPDHVALKRWFDSIDVDHDGSLSVMELQAALREGGFSFSLGLVAQIIRQCDGDASTTITFDEFGRLHSFLSTVQKSFIESDTDASGRLSLAEIHAALQRFGYTIDPSALRTVFQRFDPMHVGSLGVHEFLALTLFLRSATATFKAFDAGGTGMVHLNFNQFLYASASTI